MENIKDWDNFKSESTNTNEKLNPAHKEKEKIMSKIEKIKDEVSDLNEIIDSIDISNRDIFKQLASINVLLDKVKGMI